MTVGETIRIKREEIGITQQELADKLFVSRQTVSRWESGSRCPDLIMSRKIATTLGISMDELIPTSDTTFSHRIDQQPRDSMKLFAGFDCGGSKTRCMLVTEDGEVLGVGKSGPSNYLFCGKLAAGEAIKESIKKAFDAADIPICRLEGIFVASASVEVFGGNSHEKFFEEVTGCTNVVCNSDVFPVWYAGSRFTPAVVMIAGTGTVAYLLDGQRFVKASGWGPLFGDDGSGYDIGINAARIFSRMSDGRIPADEEFCREIMRFFGVESPRSLLRAFNQGDHRERAASTAEVVMHLYDNNNKTARELVKYAADELALSAKTVAARSDVQVALVLSGGLLQNDTPLRRELIERVSSFEKINKIVTPACDAVRSAAAIALLNNGRDDAAERLMQLCEE